MENPFLNAGPLSVRLVYLGAGQRLLCEAECVNFDQGSQC